MAPKRRTKVTLKVVSDGVQVDGNWRFNGEVFQTTEAKAKRLLKTGVVDFLRGAILETLDSRPHKNAVR